MGNWPYGYYGFGDIAVFIFFGLIGVGGTFYLHTHQLNKLWLLPAISHGSLIVGVLNLNNLRDLVPDAQVGKKTLAVRWGRNSMVYYHWALIVVSLGASMVFWILYSRSYWPLGESAM